MKKLKQKIREKLSDEEVAKLKNSLRIARVIKNIVCWTIVAVLTLAVIIFMLTRASGSTPSVFGFSVQRITSASMEPELVVGDIIINKDISDASEVKIGDVITFQSDFPNQKVTHRVIVAPYDDGRGNTVLVTMGDASDEDDGEIDFSRVESKFFAKSRALKWIYDFFFSPWGLVVFIFLLLLIFVDEILNIIKFTIKVGEQDAEESEA